jgi:hypothetical protein
VPGRSSAPVGIGAASGNAKNVTSSHPEGWKIYRGTRLRSGEKKGKPPVDGRIAR